MFQFPCKSINVLHACSENREELHETQPVSSRGTRKRVKTKKKKPKQQQNATLSVSTTRLSTDDAHKERKEKKYRPDEPIVRGIFQIGKKSYYVVLTATRVTLTPIQSETPTGEQRRALFAAVSMVIVCYTCFRPVCLTLKVIYASCTMHMQSQHWKSACTWTQQKQRL